ALHLFPVLGPLAMSLPDTEHVPPPRHRPQSLRTIAVVIYVTLALLVLAIPQAVPNWLKGFEPSTPQSLLLDAAVAVPSFANRMGGGGGYRGGRRICRETTGKRED